MKFEKLSDNKIRIILSITDLVEKDIDFHVFMSNTIESQDILLDMLDEAKKQEINNKRKWEKNYLKTKHAIKKLMGQWWNQGGN